MGERIVQTTDSCLKCPLNHYRECSKTGQSVSYWIQNGGLPAECPLPKWPKFTEPPRRLANDSTGGGDGSS